MNAPVGILRAKVAIDEELLPLAAHSKLISEKQELKLIRVHPSGKPVYAEVPTIVTLTIEDGVYNYYKTRINKYGILHPNCGGSVEKLLSEKVTAFVEREIRDNYGGAT